MLLADEGQVREWAESVKRYEVARKKVAWDHAGTPVQRVTMRDVKMKESLYDPILQKYNSDQAELKARVVEKERIQQLIQKTREKTMKYDQAIDIITLEPNPAKPKTEVFIEKTKNRLGPTNQVNYNIINNAGKEGQPQTAELLEQQRRERIEQNRREKKDFSPPPRDFNIVSNRYCDKHDEKTTKDTDNARRDASERFFKSHDYNVITAKFYDEAKQKEFEEQRKKEEELHMKKAIAKIPATWKYRERLIMDPSKGVPEDLKIADQRKRIKKMRYELRYSMEGEYKERDVENQLKREAVIRSKLHDLNPAKATEGLDIISLEPISSVRALHVRKDTSSTWDKLVRSSHNTQSPNHLSLSALHTSLASKTNAPTPQLSQSALHFVSDSKSGTNISPVPNQRGIYTEGSEIGDANIKYFNEGSYMDSKMPSKVNNELPRLGNETLNSGSSPDSRRLAEPSEPSTYRFKSRFRNRDPMSIGGASSNESKPDLKLGDEYNVLKLLANEKKGPIFKQSNYFSSHAEPQSPQNRRMNSTNSAYQISSPSLKRNDSGLMDRPRWNTSTAPKITRTQSGGFFPSP
eukprot:TRINITY_DN1143_c0_g1_i1.p1 TRINITY_DN1143_c0_g1~~TRINITY_DN1143_c0_g1_i1.p1  ORF type:complete len:578 (-),score=53.64 TRINITY_DN1143_c0_g1_i1:83-1816(-)